VVVELVPNHTSDQCAWFQASRDPEHAEHARYRDWYVWSDTAEKYGEARVIFRDFEPSNWSFAPLRRQHYWHRFFSHQPDLNYDNPDVQREMLRVVQFWSDLGVDAFRVDATPYLYEREGTGCENLPETHAYLKRLRAFVDAYTPGTMLLSEANQWPEDVRPYFGDDPMVGPGMPEFHMNFHFPLMPRIFMALARGDRTPIVEILLRTPGLPRWGQWATFLRNHDELTLEMVTEEERQFMWDYYAPEPRMRLNLGIRRRLAPLLGNDRGRLELANSLLFTLPGSPVIYYGDEIGMGDNIFLEDRRGVRTPMQWADMRSAGFSEADPSLLYSPVITDETYGYHEVNVAAQRDEPGSLLNRMRKMIAVRKAYPTFGRGNLRFIDTPNPAVFAFTRTYQTHTLLCIHNLSDQPQEANLAVTEAPCETALDLLTGEDEPAVTKGACRVRLPRYGYAWLELRGEDG
jgi:maltose alpha-D-glucosyltransferase/alpha-amylase